MEDRKKRIIVILMVLTIIFTISGGTLAYWTWTSNESQKTAVTFTATKDFTRAADGGGNITEQDAFIAPTSCTENILAYGNFNGTTAGAIVQKYYIFFLIYSHPFDIY